MIPGIVAQAVPGGSVPGGIEDPYWDYVVFLMHGEGADGDTTFFDRSQYARNCASVGGAVVDTDISVKDTPSILLGANARYVNCTYDGSLNISSVAPDFCMEAYVYCTDVSQNNQLFGRRRNSDNYIMGVTGNNLTFSTFDGTTGTSRLNVAAGMSNNTLHHLCVIRVGQTYYGFVGGVLKGSNTSTAGMGISGTNLLIGESENDQSARYWRGNVNWLRITMAQRYNIAGFTPPDIPYGTIRPDPVATPAATFSNVKLLCGFNGTDGDTAFTEESSAARVATFVGNAQLDTSQSKFGSASLLLDGSGDYITFPHSTDLDLPTGSASTDCFCIEAWVRATGSWKAQNTIASNRSGSGSNGYTLNMAAGIPNFFALAGGNSCVTLIGRDVLALDEWHHVAVSADRTHYRLFANGVLVAVAGRTSTPTLNTTVLYVGRDPSNTSRDFQGWIDELRYTKGQTVYDNTFEVPTAAFPRS